MKKILLFSMVMLAGAGCATGGRNCSSAFPQGMTGTIRTVLNVTLPGNAGNGFYLKNPWDQIAYVQTALTQKAAANPNGPQLQFIDIQHARRSDLFLGVILYGQFSRGNDHDWLFGDNTAIPIGAAWAVVNASGLNSGTDWLFNTNTKSYAFTQDSQPLNTILDESAGVLYKYIANGWRCN